MPRFSFGRGQCHSSAEMAKFWTRRAARRGRGDDHAGYEDTEGNRTGFEVDLANLLAARIFGNSPPLIFNTIPAKLRKAGLLRRPGANGDVPPRWRTQEPYYTDAVAVMVLASSPYQAPEELAGRSIGCINRDGTNMRYSARNALNAFAEGQNPKCTVIEYSSSADMIADLANGKLSGVCMEYALLFSYFSADAHRILPQAIGTISYSLAFQPGSTALVEIANEMIREMRADGSLGALLQKWSLEDYSQK